MEPDHGSHSSWGIGDVARRAAVTERTLRYYEELGLLAPGRDPGGRRRYDAGQLDRLYRVRLLRALGTPLGDLDPDRSDLAALTRRHLAELDERLAVLARERERVRSVEARLLGGQAPSDEALLDLLAGMPVDEPAATRRITLLVYSDLVAAHRHLVDVLGFAAGEVARDGEGRAVHAEVHAGDGVVWLHPEQASSRLASPGTLGASTACLAIQVDDVDAHHARVRDAGGVIDYPPTDMSYGVREYGARDLEDHLWSFQQPIMESG